MFTAMALVCGLVGDGFEEDTCRLLEADAQFETEYACQEWIYRQGLLDLLMMLSESGQTDARVDDVYCQEYLGEAL
jgi:hypothetical protein